MKQLGRLAGLPAQLLVIVVRLYRWALSSRLPRVCRFHPSCSEYAEQAITKYGLLHGGWLALRRVLRCHPYNAGGYDPVP